MLLQFHEENGHMDREKVYPSLASPYYWPNMFVDCYHSVDSYGRCWECSIMHKIELLQDTDVPGFPFQKISVDFSGPYPVTLTRNKYILHVVYWLILWPECFFVLEKTTHTVAEILLQLIFQCHSTPSAVVTDNGAAFISKLLKQMFKQLHV